MASAAVSNSSSRKRTHDVLSTTTSGSSISANDIPQILVTVPRPLPSPSFGGAQEQTPMEITTTSTTMQSNSSSGGASIYGAASSYKGFKSTGSSQSHSQQQSEADNRVEHMVSKKLNWNSLAFLSLTFFCPFLS